MEKSIRANCDVPEVLTCGLRIALKFKFFNITQIAVMAAIAPKRSRWNKVAAE